MDNQSGLQMHTEIKKDLRASWKQALTTFFLPVFLFILVRWLIAEPFVIPSGSMIPTLLVHDHILVNKISYSAHWPFSKKTIFSWSQPRRGDIIVFRYPKEPDIFYVKRLVGLPGDRLEFRNQRLFINDEEQVLSYPEESELQKIMQLNEDSDQFEYFKENSHWVRLQYEHGNDYHQIVIPEQMYFALGDNRDQSSDSRVWGFVPEENIIGKAFLVWLSCQETLASAQFICDPQTIRWNRILHTLH